MPKQLNRTAYRLTESAIMLAFAAVLSVIKIVDMPYGGSVSAFSMLPLLFIAYRYGTMWGLVTAFTYSLIQLLLGLDNFAWVQGFASYVTLAVFDYLLAFLGLGLGGLFRRKDWSQGTSLAVASVVTGLLRYLCHVVSGFTVWRDMSVPFGQSLAYSLSYNATYMIPEILLLVFGSVYLSRFLSFESAEITRAEARRSVGGGALAVSVVAKTVALAAAVWVVALVSPALQNAESGELFLKGFSAVPWCTVGIVAACGVVGWLVLEWVSRWMRREK